MKTLKIISLLIIFACLYYLSPLLFWIAAVPTFTVLIMCQSAKTLRKAKESVEVAYKSELSKIKFNHIKLVTLNGRIRVFSKWGNFLCDIYEDGYIKDAFPRVVLLKEEKSEITQINLNFLLIYNQLKEHENSFV